MARRVDIEGYYDCNTKKKSKNNMENKDRWFCALACNDGRRLCKKTGEYKFNCRNGIGGTV